MKIKHPSIRYAAILALATSASMLAMPAVMAQTGTAASAPTATASMPHAVPPRPTPAAVVSQLGLTGSKASQVEQLLAQGNAARIQFRQAAKARHEQLKQLLTPQQWEQLRHIEHPHADGDGHGHHHGPHGHSHDGQQDMTPAPAASAA